MAISYYIKNVKWFDQINNGVNFNENLTKYKDSLAGYSIGKYKTEQDVYFQVYYYAGDRDLTYTTQKTIKVDGVDWRAEGFEIGDEVRVRFFDASNGNNEVIEDGTIEFISNDGTIGLDIPFSSSANKTISYLNISLREFQSALIYKFGLIPNNEQFSNKSLLTNNSMAWYGSDIPESTSSGRDMIWLGNIQDSKTGSANIRHVTTTAIDSANFEFFYRISHEFVLFPFYQDGDLTNLQNRIAPDYLKGDNSLKYVSNFEFRRDLSNPNTSKIINSDNILSSVAWFNENYNGFNNLYQIGSGTYIDTVTSQSAEGLQVGSKTTYSTTITKPSGNVSTNHTVFAYVSKLPEQSEYTDTTTDFESNWLYDSLGADVFATETGTGIIKEIRVGASNTTTITVEIDVEYSSAEQQKLELGDNYLIGLAVQDNSASAGNEDTVCLLADVEDYVTSADIADLATMPQFNIYDHTQGTAYSNYIGWNEDGIYADCNLVIRRDKQAYINTLAGLLVAYNSDTGSYFELDRFDITWNDILSGGVQQINYSGNRGYQPSITNEMSNVEATLISSDATTATYNIKFAQKLTWDTTTFNQNANGDFYNATEPNNNLNYKASNYSNLQGYEIRLAILTNIYGVDDLGRSGNTDYLFLSPSISVNDYETPADITGTIEVLDVATGVSLGTSPTVDRDSKLRLTWSKTGGITEDPTNFFINRIFDGLTAFESSNLVTYSGGILKDLSVTYSGGDAIAECIIDYTKLQSGKEYSLSGRCKVGEGISENAKLKTDGQVKLKTDGVIKLKAV